MRDLPPTSEFADISRIIHFLQEQNIPFSTPVSDFKIENQKEDVPGYLEGEGYALFNYDESLSYIIK